LSKQISILIRRSCRHELGGPLFGTQCSVLLKSQVSLYAIDIIAVLKLKTEFFRLWQAQYSEKRSFCVLLVIMQSRKKKRKRFFLPN